MRPIAPPKPPLHVVVRDPKRTRERILAAALKEFSTKGLAGARVDRIARRARINKRMLYHYFGHKDDLFREILRRKLQARVAWAAAAPDAPGETLTHWFKLACEDMDWVRLIEWEALTVGDGPVLSGPEGAPAFAVGLCAAALGRSACGERGGDAAAAKAAGRGPAVPVTVSDVATRDVPIQVRAIGNVQAYATVSVLSLVGGELFRIHFTEGQDVKAGDVLFTIDPRPVQAALQQAEAQLAQHQAQVAQAQANLVRD